MTTRTDATSCRRAAGVELGLLNLSEQWLLAESVAEMLLQDPDLGVEVMYTVGECPHANGHRPLSILATTSIGSLAFVEDPFGIVWLAQWAGQTPVAPAHRILLTDDVSALAKRCFERLGVPVTD